MANKRVLVVTQHFWPENFRINDIVEGFLADGLEVDVLCGLPNYPKGEWFDGYGPHGPFEEHYRTAQVFRAREWPRKGNTSVNIFLNYVSWPLYAAAALRRLPGGYDAVFCFNTSPVLMCWPAIRYAKKARRPFYKLCARPVAGKPLQRAAGQKRGAARHSAGGERLAVQTLRPADCDERTTGAAAARAHR